MNVVNLSKRLTARQSVALLAVLCAAFALRVYRLDASGFWYDEAWSHLIALRDLPAILEYSRTPFQHPPLYYLLLHGWMLVAGDSEFAMRFLSLLFSVLIVALLYRFTRRWFSPGLARWAIVLAALSPFGVVYAQEARMYIVALCVSIISLDYCLRWLESGERRAGLIYFILTLLCFSIHYYTALLLLVEDIYVLIVAWRRFRSTRVTSRDDARHAGRQWLRSVLMQWLSFNGLLILLLGSWVALSAGPRAALAEQISRPLFEGRNLIELQRNLVFLVLGGIVFRPLSLAELILSAFLLLMVALGALWLWRTQPKNPRSFLLMLLVIVPPIAASPVPLNYNARYFFMTVPALIILSAAALQRLQARGRWVFATALVAVLMANAYGIYFNYNFVKNAYREMAAVVIRTAHPDDALIFDGPHQEFLSAYYLRGPWARREIPKDAAAAELSDVDAELRAMQQAHPRLWLIAQQSSSVDPANNAARWLSLNAYPVSTHWFQYDDFVTLFLSGRTDTASAHWDVAFGEWLMLEQSAISTHSAAPGDGLAVTLTWHALKRIPQKERLLVTLRLFDQQGRVIQERVAPPCDGFCPIDDWAPGDAVADHHGLLVPRAAPAGEYVLRLEVYAPRQQQSLPIKRAHGDLGASLELARINVQGTATSAQR